MKPTLQKPRSRGIFLTLEGGEGSGKTTLSKHLKAHYEAQGKEVILTREPGGCAFAEKLRDLVLNTKEELSSKAELLLFLSARAQHIASLIKPAISRGAVVICDRFSDSTLAYQGVARGLGIEDILSVVAYAEASCKPDRTYLLDLDPTVGFHRIKKRKASDRIEKAGIDFHARVREGFLELARRFPERICVLDAIDAPENVLKRVLEDLEGRFS